MTLPRQIARGAGRIARCALAASAVVVACISLARGGGVASFPKADRAVSEWFEGFRPEGLLRMMPSATPESLRYADEYIGPYEVIGDAVPIGDGDAARVAELLASGDAFEPSDGATCPFKPGVSVRCRNAAGFVDLLVCFGCDEVLVVPGGGEPSGLYRFPQTTRDTLLALAKSLLPDDEAVQELPGVRRDRPAPPPFAPRPRVPAEGN